MKFLFICSADKQRSKTAEDYFALKYTNEEFTYSRLGVYGRIQLLATLIVY